LLRSLISLIRARADLKPNRDKIPSLVTLPLPRQQLAGCFWLARLVVKARLYKARALPAEYANRFCHPTGVDHQFLSFFDLNRDSLLDAVNLDDSAFATWFLGQPQVTESRIADWNRLAVNLGRSGFPMAERLPVALSTSYKHLDSSGITSVFEAIEQDEQQS
jgi:hypothetical protein